MNGYSRILLNPSTTIHRNRIFSNWSETLSHIKKCKNGPYTYNEIYFQRNFAFWSKGSGNNLQPEKNYEIIQPGLLPKDHAILTKNMVSSIPSQIRLPEYANTSIPIKEDSTIKPGELYANVLTIWSENDIKRIRKSCKLAKNVLRTIANTISLHSQSVSPCTKLPKYRNLNDQKVLTTNDLNNMAHEMIISANAYPSQLNFNGFPKSISTSVNNVAAHGIPDDRPLQLGDMINVDVSVYCDGFHGDCAETFMFGDNCDAEGYHLMNSSKECLFAAIAACAPGAPLRAIGHSVSKFSKRRGVKAISNLCGHGIGTLFHMGEDIYHVPNHYLGTMKPGNVFTIEPHITEGFAGVEISADGFSLVTRDSARVAMYEHTVLVTEYGIDLLTL